MAMSKILDVALAGGASAALGYLATASVAPDWTITGTLGAGIAGGITAASRHYLMDLLERQSSTLSSHLQRTLMSDFRHSKISTCENVLAARKSLIQSFSKNIGDLTPISPSREFITFRGDDGNRLPEAVSCLYRYLHNRSPGLQATLAVAYPAIAPAIDLTIDAMNRRLSDSGICIVKHFNQSTSKDGTDDKCDFAFMAVDAAFYKSDNRLRMILPVYDSHCAVLLDKRPMQASPKTIVLNESASMSQRKIAFNQGAIARKVGDESVECSADFITQARHTDPGDIVFAWEAISHKLVKLNPNLGPCTKITPYPRTVCLFADKSWCCVQGDRMEPLQAFVKIFSYEWNRMRHLMFWWRRLLALLGGQNPRLEIAGAFEEAVT